MVATKFDGKTEDQRIDEDEADLEELRRLAEAGDPQSQTLLGHEYFNSEDYAEATKWYLAAALQGHDEAQAALGDVYCYGSEEFQNHEEAVKWYRKAAEQGHPGSQTAMGNMYYDGLGVLQDYKEALEWYKKAAEQEDPDGQTALGNMYYDGAGVAQDYEKAVKWYELAAEQGHSEAQYSLGWAYEFGEGCQEDFHRAMDFFQKASDQNHAVAQYRLGLMYSSDRIPQDLAAGEKWFRKAAEQGVPEAQSMLGLMLANGEGTEKNLTEAIEWFREAAEQGDPYGQYELGRMVLYGLGTPADPAEAIEWFRKAASLGNSEAEVAAKHLESVERELRQLGLTYEARKERIARLLLLVPREADGNWPWMDEKPLSKRNANKFFLYAILDYQMHVDIVYQNVVNLAEKTFQDTPDLWNRIVQFSQQEWEEKFLNKEVFLHRYRTGHMRVWHIGKDIVEKYHGDAREIWKNQTPDEVLARLKSLGRGKEGIGNKLSAMTMGALFDSGQLLVNEGNNPLDVKVDMHVKRVLGRALRGTGFEDSEAITVLEETRKMYPPIPYLLDQALYYLGKETCHKNNPDCENCFLRSECAFRETALNR